MIRHSAIVLALLATIGLDSAIGAPKAPEAKESLTVAKPLWVVSQYLEKHAEQYRADVPDPVSLGLDEITAYEEHKNFVYIVGQARWTRGRQRYCRFILLKPRTLVMDHYMTGQPATSTPPKRGLLGHTVSRHTMSGGGGRSGGPHTSSSQTNFSFDTGRIIMVLGVPGESAPVAKSDVSGKEFVLNITDASGAAKLTLPSDVHAAGSIAIADAKGKAILPQRLLPSGIMPHGPKGVKMLAGWDSRYTRKNAAPWDTKKVAVELKKAVESGKIKPGRAVVLGCGAGTNSIYLASKGFDVTAIDIAPTALEIAKQRAAKAKVKVNWMLADVTAVPKLKAFDFMYDRGCYHGVRRSFAKEFVASAKKLSKPGTQFLILAGNANEARHYGPPRVKEEDIRNDFKALFDFTWLRESKFGPNGEKGKGPLMWSILMTRKSK